MTKPISDILKQDTFNKSDLIALLAVGSDKERRQIFAKAEEKRLQTVGSGIYLRGLIEYSNRCEKNCNYCGIRAGNKRVKRYNLEMGEVLGCVAYAIEHDYGSLAIQAGERTDQEFVDAIDEIIKQIQVLSRGETGITLSCGEQSKETYKRWLDSGASRYLLRIEATVSSLYNELHPANKKHSQDRRFQALRDLKEIGFQAGSGVMIGLPGQTYEQLASDLLFFKEMDLDMIGMGPYIEHKQTPLYHSKKPIPNQKDRLELSLLMIAVLRLLMPDINIAASTALDSLDENGRIRAIKSGANVLMPNLTPLKYREDYFLYDNKPYLREADVLVEQISKSEILEAYEIRFSEKGDSLHYQARL